MDKDLGNRFFTMLAVMPLITPLIAGAADSISFDRLDANKDGRFSAVEASKESRLSSLWTEVDQDKSGTIDRAGFSAFESMLDKAESTQKGNPKNGVE